MGGASTVQQANNQWEGQLTGILGDTAQLGAKVLV
jgi:hypothetical protein